MKTTIFYYTGTGNSLWTARQIAAEIGPAEIIPLSESTAGTVAVRGDSVGLVFPVHMWGVPVPVINFLRKFEADPDAYFFAAAVNAGQVSRTLIQLRGLMRSRGLDLSAGLDIVLPSNYIPWGGPPPASRQQKLFEAARQKIKTAAPAIRQRRPAPVDRGPLWQRIIFTALYRMTYNMIPRMDRDFWSDEKCNSCRICEKICPVANISLRDGRPEWHHRCEQCLSCIQWCPRESIQIGKKTPAYGRYHHPEVTLKEIMADRKSIAGGRN